MWIDAHCHLADPRLAEGIDDLVARSRAAGVVAWLQGGVSPEDWQRQRRLRDRFGDGIVMAFGLHPWWLARADEAAAAAAWRELERQAPDAPLIGETGLDKAARGGDKQAYQRQLAFFTRTASLARSLHKPLVLHVVRAHADAARILGEAGPLPAGGLVHGFQGGLEEARAYLRLGLHISLGRGIAKEGVTRLKEALPSLPPAKLLLETDAPEPVLPGGGPSEPAVLPQVAAVAAAVIGRGSGEEMLASSSDAVRRLIGWETSR